MAKWREYQEEAAASFRSLGLEAETDAQVSGVRGVHAVDVLVRRELAGISQRRIVECKCWAKKVDKVHVAALAEIVSDIGADRGLLLSEKGFQAGAIRMAQGSNVTLTSLDDLRLNYERIMRLSTTQNRGGSSFISTPKPGASLDVIIRMHAFAGMAESSLSQAEVGRWPVLYRYDVETDRGFRASDKSELLAGLRRVVSHIEGELVGQEQAVAERSAQG